MQIFDKIISFNHYSEFMNKKEKIFLCEEIFLFEDIWHPPTPAYLPRIFSWSPLFFREIFTKMAAILQKIEKSKIW